MGLKLDLKYCIWNKHSIGLPCPCSLSARAAGWWCSATAESKAWGRNGTVARLLKAAVAEEEASPKTAGWATVVAAWCRRRLGKTVCPSRLYSLTPLLEQETNWRICVNRFFAFFIHHYMGTISCMKHRVLNFLGTLSLQSMLFLVKKYILLCLFFQGWSVMFECHYLCHMLTENGGEKLCWLSCPNVVFTH